MANWIADVDWIMVFSSLVMIVVFWNLVKWSSITQYKVQFHKLWWGFLVAYAFGCCVYGYNIEMVVATSEFQPRVDSFVPFLMIIYLVSIINSFFPIKLKHNSSQKEC